MASLVPITAKAVTIEGYRLETPTDMLTALTFLSGLQQSYTGSINCQPIDGVMTWWLTLVNPHGVGGTAYVNDWIILENGTAAVTMRDIDFDTFYTRPA